MLAGATDMKLIHRCQGCDRELDEQYGFCPDCDEAIGTYEDEGEE